MSKSLPDLHIAIPTHGRPEQFKKCLRVVLSQVYGGLNNSVFVHILCDDGTVTQSVVDDIANEYYTDQKPFINLYKFHKFESDGEFNLSERYKALFSHVKNKAKHNDFMLYLEDDDVLCDRAISEIFYNIDSKTDECNHLYNYHHGYGSRYELKHKLEFLEFHKIKNHNFVSSSRILKEYNPKHFQLGMMVFKLSNIDIADFPDGNKNENDLELFKVIKGRWDVHNFELFNQGWDNENNYSFIQNKDTL